MAVNIEITKNNNENTGGVLRRFTRKMQGSGILPRIRSIRYYERPFSKLLSKKQALKRIARREEREQLIKLGRIDETVTRRRGR